MNARYSAIKSGKTNVNKDESLLNMFTTVLEKGPECGVHVFMQIDKPNNFMFSDDTYIIRKRFERYFNHLILQRSEENTSINLGLQDRLKLNELENNGSRLRAYYYNRESAQEKLFTPFVIN